ncbi:hypothetical protein CRYUN_Cryun21dG0098600 [Craigia yunnanensis]
MSCTYDLHFYASFSLLELFPKIELNIQRDFSKAVLSEDGSKVSSRRGYGIGVDVWPAVRTVMEYMEQFDRNDDGLIENDGFPDQTYDAWTVHGISVYCGCLWLAALQAAVAAMAQHLGDNGSSSNSKSIQADQLAGQWYTASSGLAPLFDEFKTRSALRKIYDFNVMKVKGGRMDAVNGMHPNEKSGQAV